MSEQDREEKSKRGRLRDRSEDARSRERRYSRLPDEAFDFGPPKRRRPNPAEPFVVYCLRQRKWQLLIQHIVEVHEIEKKRKRSTTRA